MGFFTTRKSVNILMRYVRYIVERMTAKRAAQIPIETRHKIVDFIHRWLSGQFMGKQRSDKAAQGWRTIAEMFPPEVPAQIKLYRVVTVPLALVQGKKIGDMITLTPTLNSVASWSLRLAGTDPVAGIAREFKGGPNTARIAIAAVLPGKSVLATPRTIRDAFLILAHDYWTRFPERTTRTPTKDGMTTISTDHVGYPETTPDGLSMDDVGFYMDVLNRPGGHYRQYEVIAEAPPTPIQAQIVRVYRRGLDDVRQGNDDPHYMTFKRRKNFNINWDQTTI